MSTTTQGSDAPPTAKRTTKLEQLALRGTAITLGGRAIGEAIRFGSNLLLARLLFPEAFGLMAIVNAVLQGARMMTDVGIRGSIVQNARGEEPLFRDTAWTVGIVRGAAIAAGLALLAGPIANAFDKPEATWLIRVAALCSLIEGLRSTAAFTLMRKVRVGRQVARDILAKSVAIAVMITWALASPSVWALVAGTVTGSLMQLFLSFRMIPGYRNRLAWDRRAVADILGFGRWVFAASLMTFLVNQGDRLALGKMLDVAELGVYAIALGLTQSVPEIAQQLSANILFPVYARLKTLDLAEQRRQMERFRAAILAAALPVLWALAFLGPVLVSFLYDARYQAAGWMVPLLAAATAPTIVSLSAERALMARGDSFAHMLLQGAQAACSLGGIAAGFALWGGARGVLLGLVIGRWLSYVPLAVLLRPIGLWLPRLDLLALGLSALAFGLAVAFHGAP